MFGSQGKLLKAIELGDPGLLAHYFLAYGEICNTQATSLSSAHTSNVSRCEYHCLPSILTD